MDDTENHMELPEIDNIVDLLVGQPWLDEEALDNVTVPLDPNQGDQNAPLGEELVAFLDSVEVWRGGV